METLSATESYSRVAGEYAAEFYHELDGKILDRTLLKRFAESVMGRGIACDLGCGPGEIAHYLYEQGLTSVIGMDLAEGMIEQASRLDARIPFSVGDMLCLPVQNDAWVGIAAFYSIVHFQEEQARKAFAEMYRVLQPDGLALITFHIGEGSVRRDEWYGQPVDITWYLFDVDDVGAWMQAAGFEMEDVIIRHPYPGVEHPSRRAYLFARKKV